MVTTSKKLNKRIEKDLHKVYKSGRFKVFFDDESNLNEFQIEIKAPEESIYKDSFYRLNFVIPDEYPFKSPSVAFANKIYHPNIEFSSGSICLNTLNKNWSAIYDLINVVDVMIPQLLVNPNPSDPFNVEASRMFTADMELYRNEVNRCIETHSCRKAYEKKFYKDGFDLELEKEEHPYYYSNDESEEKKLKSNPEIKTTATFGQSKQKEKNNDETPFLKMESSVGLFLMDRSKTPEIHKPLSKGFKKVRSFTSFKKVSESDGNKSPVSSRSNLDILSLKQSHPVDYKLFDLDKKHKDYLFNLGFPTKETGDRFGITEH